MSLEYLVQINLLENGTLSIVRLHICMDEKRRSSTFGKRTHSPVGTPWGASVKGKDN